MKSVLACLSIISSLMVAVWVFVVKDWAEGIQTDALLQVAYTMENQTGVYMPTLHIMPILLWLLGILSIISFAFIWARRLS